VRFLGERQQLDGQQGAADEGVPAAAVVTSQ
jgi:hypothetical protein